MRRIDFMLHDIHIGHALYLTFPQYLGAIFFSHYFPGSCKIFRSLEGPICLVRPSFFQNICRPLGEIHLNTFLANLEGHKFKFSPARRRQPWWCLLQYYLNKYFKTTPPPKIILLVMPYLPCLSKVFIFCPSLFVFIAYLVQTISIFYFVSWPKDLSNSEKVLAFL